MIEEDGVEFEMPLMLADELHADPQFYGMRRRFWIGRAAMMAAIDTPVLTMPVADLYAKFNFDIWMAVRKGAWLRKPDADGLVRLRLDDIG